MRFTGWFFHAQVFMLCFTWMCAPAQTIGNDDQTDVKSQIRKAWEYRQQETRTARFVWTEARTQVDATGKAARYRVDDVTLVFDGDKFRYETEFVRPETGTEQDPHRYLTVFDGDRSQLYRPTGSSRPEAVIFPEQTFSEKHNLYIRPILLLCRPLTEGGLDIQLETYRVEPKRSVVDTRECVVLTEVAGSRPGGLQNVMWLDPQAAYIPLQFIEKVHGHNTIQIAMHYSEDASHGWLVTKWTVSWLNPNGSLNQSADCEVTREQINVPIDPGEFEVDYPVDTFVTDQRTDTQFVVLPGGKRQMIPKGGAPAPRTRSWILWINLMVICTLVVILLCRRAVAKRV